MPLARPIPTHPTREIYPKWKLTTSHSPTSRPSLVLHARKIECKAFNKKTRSLGTYLLPASSVLATPPPLWGVYLTTGVLHQPCCSLPVCWLTVLPFLEMPPPSHSPLLGQFLFILWDPTQESPPESLYWSVLAPLQPGLGILPQDPHSILCSPHYGTKHTVASPLIWEYFKGQSLIYRFIHNT